MSGVSRPLAAAVLLLGGLLVPLAPTAQSATEAGPEWFGPTGPDEGWHMRIAVTVENPYDGRVLDAPVAAELDIASALLEAGWTGFDGGTSAVLTGFDLDLNSFRVVQMSNLEPFTGSGTNGRILREVPSLAMPGHLGLADPATATRAFSATSDPLVTVFFRVPGGLDPGQKAHFLVYFDSLRNGAKPPAGYTGPDAGALESMHWSTAGTRLYGHVPTAPGQANQVTVLALADAQVTVRRHQAGQFLTTGVTTTAGNPATLAAGSSLVATLGAGANPVFRIDATGPVVAFVDPVGFVPAADGGFAGSEFRFRTPKDSSTGGGEEGLYVINVGPSPAQVRLTRAGGAARTFTVAAEPGLPYGGSTLGCSVPGSWQPAELDRNYRLEVLDGGPVLVQLQPRQHQQVPTVDGAPAGTRFLATAQWSVTQCGQPAGQALRAAALASGALLRVRSLEDPDQVFPPAAGGGAPPAASLPAPPDLSEILVLGTSRAVARDRPLQFTATQPIHLYAGGVAPQGQAPPLAGPLGGTSAGRSFAGAGPMILVAPYPETHFTATVRYALGSATVSGTLGADGIHPIEDHPQLGRVLSARIVSQDRPLLVYPAKAPPGFLAGVPAFLDTTVAAAAQYRGHLLEIRSANGDDPATVTVKADATTTVDLFVANRGRGVGNSPGPTENVHVEVTNKPADWVVTPFPADFTLAPGAEATVSLQVRPPAGSGAGTPPASLTVAAFSVERRQDVRDDLTVIASVQTSYGVGLWFLQADSGPKTLSLNVPPGGEVVYPVVVKNTGSLEDTVLLSARTPELPEGVRLLDAEGRAVQAVKLEPGEVKGLDLVVQPGALQDGLLVTTVTAQSQVASSALDRITAVSRIRSASDLNMTSPAPLLLLPDGSETLFRVLLSNPGRSSSDVRLALVHDIPEDWADPAIFVLDGITGRRVPIGGFTLDPESSQVLFVNVTPPRGAPAGRLVNVHLAATPGAGAAVDLPMAGLVRARHDVAVLAESDPVRAAPGRVLELGLSLVNRGNLNETLNVTLADAPPGWLLTRDGPAHVAMGETARATLRLRPATAAPPGLYPVTFRWFASDGGSFTSTLNFTLGADLGEVAAGTHVLDAQPGRPVAIAVPVNNTGNQPVVARLLPAQGEPWSLATSPVTTLAPGAATTLVSAWAVPRDAPDGASVHRATVLLEGPTGRSTQAIHGFTVEVARANLLLANVTAMPGPAGGLVRGVLVNDGDRPAFDVAVTLADGRERLADQVIDRLEPGERADILLAVPREVPEGAQLRADPGNAVIERAENDNVAPLRSPDSAESPGLGVGAALAAVGLLLWGRRRR